MTEPQVRPAPRDYNRREAILWDGRERLIWVVNAMQRKHDVWWRCWGVFWRKPWRASHRPRWSRPLDVLDWLRKAHDCADPAVGCSCSGGFRYGK